MNNSKKRFSLQFDISDPVQKFAYSVLATQGRRKADFIARAVKYYAETSPDIVQSSDFYDKDFVKAVILSVLEEIQPNTNRTVTLISAPSNIEENKVFSSPQNENRPQKPHKTEESKEETPEPVVDDSALDMLLNGLNMFG